jgi:16S rRNA (cytosine967-C5)-methyltransferase
MKVSPARRSAFGILLKIARDRAFSSVLLLLEAEKLQPPDRRLCYQITLGVLRNRLRLDREIDMLAGGKRLDEEVRIALQIGLFQLRSLDRIPEHSIVYESVQLAVMARKSSARGFVNAILRKAARHAPVFEYKDELEQISIETSHPRWLIERWAEYFGLQEATSIANANNQQPPLAFRYVGKASHISAAVRPSRFVPGCWIADRADPVLAAASEKGEIYIQDEGSQMIAAAAARIAGEADRVLDVCAAPGSKTALIASLLPNSFVAAGDLYRPRTVSLEKTIRAQELLNVGVLQYDAAIALPFAERIFGLVLVDAPCSGTGTIRHNPEIRYFLRPEDIRDLKVKQLRILTAASKLVAAGGALMYSTCSLEPEENEDVCEGFLAQNIDFSVESPKVDERFITASKFARMRPDVHDMDGFFISVFRRSSP